MKKEELISSVIMCIVSVLVLVGFTIAWFTTGGSAVATGLQVVAGEMSAVKISLTSGGVDIAEGATIWEKFASFGMPDYTNVEVEANELAPGTSGEITFYVTPASGNLTFCDVSPMIAVTEDGINWYTSENIEECTSEDLKEAHGIALTHIRFFRATTDENGDAVTEENGNPVLEEYTSSSTPTRLSWKDVEMDNKENIELSVTFYWKWDYENPDIENYDEEDMILGNQVSGIKFQFLFVPQ